MALYCKLGILDGYIVLHSTITSIVHPVVIWVSATTRGRRGRRGRRGGCCPCRCPCHHHGRVQKTTCMCHHQPGCVFVQCLASMLIELNSVGAMGLRCHQGRPRTLFVGVGVALPRCGYSRRIRLSAASLIPMISFLQRSFHVS